MTATKPAPAVGVLPPETEESMYKVVADHTGCVQCGHVGTKQSRDQSGRSVDAWWVTATEDPSVNIGPFCSNTCAALWVRENE